MLIRHGEKPPDSPPPYGIAIDGQQDGESLTVRGWQRAGALACLLTSTGTAPQIHGLAEPRYLYAANPRKHRSKRSRETLEPLARKLGLEINTDFSPGQEEELATHALSRGGVVLICWRHQQLPTLARHILRNEQTETEWPEDRYDLVWVFDLDVAKSVYLFHQVAQNLLHGDSPVAAPEASLAGKVG